jgi:hypothetical protein
MKAFLNEKKKKKPAIVQVILDYFYLEIGILFLSFMAVEAIVSGLKLTCVY